MGFEHYVLKKINMDLNESYSKVIIDLEGELRYYLMHLDESKNKSKKAEEKIVYLRNLLDEGRKTVNDLETKLNDKTK